MTKWNKETIFINTQDQIQKENGCLHASLKVYEETEDFQSYCIIPPAHRNQKNNNVLCKDPPATRKYPFAAHKTLHWLSWTSARYQCYGEIHVSGSI